MGFRVRKIMAMVMGGTGFSHRGRYTANKLYFRRSLLDQCEVASLEV